MYLDTLIRIKNTEMVGRSSLKVPFSKMDLGILEVLERGGFLRSVETKGRSHKKIIEVHTNPERPIQGVKWLSKPSVRRYGTYRDFYRVKNGYGVLIVSTPKGIMSGEDARKEKVGGQLLCEVW